MGWQQVTAAAKQVGATPVVPHEYLNLHLKVKQSGYLYVYLSNENTKLTNVYFDDFLIRVTTAIEDMSNYYPFGLTYNLFKRLKSVNNRIKFQSQEHISELNLGWDSFKWRNHQPDVARFFGVDPLAEKYVTLR